MEQITWLRFPPKKETFCWLADSATGGSVFGDDKCENSDLTL